MTMTFETVTVTPPLAAEWLEKNVHNRRVDSGLVDRLSRDMRSGSWRQTGEALKFDDNGNLVDGQHRLHGVIRSGCGVKMLVIRNIEPEAQDVMDTGRVRSASDVATLHGHKNTTALMAIARVLVNYPALGHTDRAIRTPSTTELLRLLDTHDNLDQAAVLGQRYTKALGIPVSVVGAVWMRLAQVDPEQASGFFDSLAKMEFTGPNDPRAAFRRALAARPDDFRAKMVMISALLRTWNAWRAGESWSRILTTQRGRVITMPDSIL